VVEAGEEAAEEEGEEAVVDERFMFSRVSHHYC